MSSSTGGVGGAGAGGGANVHGSNETHDTRGTQGAGSADAAAGSQAHATQTAQASAADTASTTQRQAQAADGASAHPDDHFKSESVNPVGPTPSQVGALTQANVESAPAALQRAMSAASASTAAASGQPAAESTPVDMKSPLTAQQLASLPSSLVAGTPGVLAAMAASSARVGLPGPPLGAEDGLPKVDPKTSFAEFGPSFAQEVDATKPSVTVSVTNPGVLAVGDAISASVTLHDAKPDKRPGAPRVDATISYSTTATSLAQDQAAKATPTTQRPGVVLSLAATNIGTPQMAVNAEAVLKGLNWTLKGNVDFNIKTSALTFKADGSFAFNDHLSAIARYEQKLHGPANVAAGIQFGIAEGISLNAEYRNFGGISSFYTGIAIKRSF